MAALIRAAEAHAQAWRALADDTRALPELWKQLSGATSHGGTAQASGVSPRPTPSAPSAAAPLITSRGATRPISGRSDHLGASTFVAKGWNAYAAADFGAAESAFERALALAPDDAEAIALLAWARAANGRGDDALMAAQQVIVQRARGPAASLARVAIGRVCLAKGIVGEAVEHLARVVRDADDRRATLYATLYLGVAYQRREMYEDAVAFLRRALTLGPNLVEARYELGCTLWRAGAHDAAAAEWRTGSSDALSAWALRCRERLAEIDDRQPVRA